MSYLDDRITTEEFITTRGAVKTQKLARWGLHLFDLFTKDTLEIFKLDNKRYIRRKHLDN